MLQKPNTPYTTPIVIQDGFSFPSPVLTIQAPDTWRMFGISQDKYFILDTASSLTIIRTSLITPVDPTLGAPVKAALNQKNISVHTMSGQVQKRVRYGVGLAYNVPINWVACKYFDALFAENILGLLGANFLSEGGVILDFYSHTQAVALFPNWMN